MWEEDAMQRALAGLAQQEEQEGASLEGAAREAIIKVVTCVLLNFIIKN